MHMDLASALADQGLKVRNRQPGQRQDIACPKCGRQKRFSLTIDMDGKGFVGRCNRINNCAYSVGYRMKSQTEKARSKAAAELEDDRAHRAQSIWVSCDPEVRTPIEGYLRRRGILVPAPTVLRWHRNLRHSSGARGPALVAAVCDRHGHVTAVQRTWIHGFDKAALQPAKMSLGNIGHGAVKLASPGAILALAEGVEDALSLIQISATPTWACLGVARMKSVEIPQSVRTLILAPDADDAADQATESAIRHFSSLGLKVLHLRPPKGHDWNTLLPLFEERAAILQYDGQLDRHEAESLSFSEILGISPCISTA